MLIHALTYTNKVNEILEQKQQKLNQAYPQPFYSYLQGKDYVGSCDAVTVSLESRKNALLEQHAILDDVSFVLHHSIRMFLELDVTDKEQTDIVKTLKENKALVEKQAGVLKKLQEIYRSLLIEPGILQLPDVEREDPTRFRVLFEPATILTEAERRTWSANWQQQLAEFEHIMDHPPQFKKIPLPQG